MKQLKRGTSLKRRTSVSNVPSMQKFAVEMFNFSSNNQTMRHFSRPEECVPYQKP